MASRAGLGSARRLPGCREWIEHGEDIETPRLTHPGEGAVGDTHMAGSDEGQLLDRAADGSSMGVDCRTRIATAGDETGEHNNLTASVRTPVHQGCEV